MTSFNETVENIDSMMEEFEKFQEKMRLEMREKFKVLFSAFFDTFPQIKTIHWTQYTPYFNDGEECLFTLGEVYFSVTEWDDLEDAYGENDDGNVDSYGSKTLPQSLETGMKKLSSVINSNEDILRAMFDNYVWVRAHKDGFEVQDYEAPY